MKVLFAGPSLFGLDVDLGEIRLHPPAAHGDITAAVLDGAAVIGLVDGYFEATASVWHKEILYALSQGVRMLGAASMGALRAVECAPYGMEPVGRIAARYATGDLDDDAAVALQHGPAAIGYMPVSEALVDAEATIADLLARGSISRGEAAALTEAARALFFKRRSVEAIIESALAPERRAAVDAAYRRHRVSIKAEDTRLLVERLHALPARRTVFTRSWVPATTPVWQEALAAVQAGRMTAAAA